MYAIIEVGGRQYTVKKGDIIDTEKQIAEEGKELILDKVLLVSNEGKIELGKPYLKGARVQAIALGQIKAQKTVSFKYRRRKSSHWKKGHRQLLTRLKIEKIQLS